MASQIARLLPQDVQSERAILYACIVEPREIKRVRKSLTPRDFYRDAHAKIYDSMLSLGEAFDLVALRNELANRGVLQEIGGEEYLMGLGDFASTTAAVRYHTECVKSMSMRRQVIKACEDVAAECASPQVDFQESMSSFKTQLKEIESEQEPDYVAPTELFKAVYKTIETRASAGSLFVGYPTGFSAIDDNLHGIEPKCTYYLAAERHTGKSALALNIAENVAAEQKGSHVLYFTLESTKEAVAFRRLARHAKTDLTRIRIGSLHDDEMDRIYVSTSELSDRNFIILERSRFQTYEVLASFCETFSLDKKLSLVVIDYIQLLTSSKRFQNRHLELSHVSRCLNFLAKDLNCPVMILSQLNKEKGLKESGDIENNGDHIWILEREQHEQEARLRATKGKDTGTWEATLYFDKYRMTYSDFRPNLSELGGLK
jgi:replicative DNA helicase